MSGAFTYYNSIWFPQACITAEIRADRKQKGLWNSNLHARVYKKIQYKLQLTKSSEMGNIYELNFWASFMLQKESAGKLIKQCRRAMSACWLKMVWGKSGCTVSAGKQIR